MISKTKKPRLVARKPRRDSRGKPRGGAALPCPMCGGPTRVLRTTRSGGSTIRERQCGSRRCGHRIGTMEAPLHETSKK
jgi:hypothetical protein